MSSLREHFRTAFERLTADPKGSIVLTLRTKDGFEFRHVTVLREQPEKLEWDQLTEALRQVGQSAELARQLPASVLEASEFLSSLSPGDSGAGEQFVRLASLLIETARTAGVDPRERYRAVNWQVRRERGEGGVAPLKGEYLSFGQRFTSIDSANPMAGLRTTENH
jgi:hypothetical protein